MFKMYPVKKLVSHPANKDLFTDISESSPAFWLEFKASIEEFGILEPLIVNNKTMQVRSGNQRLKAAVELGHKEVPVIFVDDEDSQEEIRKMIASNVYRRALDPFKMFEYIGRLRIGARSPHGGNSPTSLKGGLSIKETQKVLKKEGEFISAADLFNTLPKDQQAALKAWFREGEKAKTEGELIGQLRAMEQAKIDAEALAAGLTDENKSMEERQEKLDEMLAERDEEIERLKALKPEEEIAERDAEIRKLEEQKRKLTQKLKEAGKPNLDRFLKDCIKWQSDVNVGLADLVANREELDQGDWKKFCGLLKNAFTTLKGAAKDGALQLEDK